MTFVVHSLLKRGSSYDFAPKTRDTEQGCLKRVATDIDDPVVWMDVRTDGHGTITSVPEFLGLIGYQICLEKVLRYQFVLIAILVQTWWCSFVAQYTELR